MIVSLYTSLALLMAALANASPVGTKKSIRVQGHRGGIGLRPENTLQAFAYSLELGVDVLEMDMLFTKDGVPVIWHDHYIYDTKCKDTATSGENFPYVGKYIANLTLAQVKTLDCGSLQLKNHNQAKLFPGAEIATLEEVLDLVDCYGNARAQLNIETKLSPIRPNETLPVEKYITDLVPLLTRRNFISRATIQSFDWRTIVAIKKRFPCTRTVALMDDTTLVETEDGVSGYPWMGGMDLAAFDGDRVAAAASTGADVLSTVHGIPSSATVNTPGYVAFTDEKMVDAAHKVGMKVVPWTVDDEETIAKMISYGVDGIISNYPQRVIFVAKDKGYKVGIKGSKRNEKCLAKSFIRA